MSVPRRLPHAVAPALEDEAGLGDQTGYLPARAAAALVLATQAAIAHRPDTTATGVNRTLLR
jgi:hypothetical protein